MSTFIRIPLCIVLHLLRIFFLPFPAKKSSALFPSCMKSSQWQLLLLRNALECSKSSGKKCRRDLHFTQWNNCSTSLSVALEGVTHAICSFVMQISIAEMHCLLEMSLLMLLWFLFVTFACWALQMRCNFYSKDQKQRSEKGFVVV